MALGVVYGAPLSPFVTGELLESHLLYVECKHSVLHGAFAQAEQTA